MHCWRPKYALAKYAVKRTQGFRFLSPFEHALAAVTKALMSGPTLKEPTYGVREQKVRYLAKDLGSSLSAERRVSSSTRRCLRRRESVSLCCKYSSASSSCTSWGLIRSL